MSAVSVDRGLVMIRKYVALAILTWFQVVSLSAQSPQTVESSELEAESPGSVELLILGQDLQDGWLELTPLDRPQLPPSILTLPARQAEQGALEFEPELEVGYYMVCSGGESWAITCEPVYLHTAEANEIRFEGGWSLIGRYLQNDLPVEGARVALVPMGFESERPYTMPLGPGERHASGQLRLAREVLTDEEGRFTLPQIAAGDYRLETVLPSGRVHRAEIELPSLPQLRLPPEATVEDANRAEARQRLELPPLDLGDYNLNEGLSTEVRVLDELGLPVPGARVGATEGLRPRDAITFDARADTDGVAQISGFTVDRRVRLTCQAPGFHPAELYFDLIPALVECTIERLARIRGEVLGIDGGVPAGGTVALDVSEEGDPQPTEVSGHSGRARQIAVDASGRFEAIGMVAGSYHLTIAAPGYVTEQQTLELQPGEALDLGAVVLRAAADLRGQVVDAETGEPLSGIVIESINPPGAASATSDGDGEFRVSFPESAAMVLRLAGVEHAPREIRVVAAELDKRDPLVIELEKGGWIAVKIINSVLPCQACRAVIQPTGEELVTDAYGEAKSGVLRAANYRVERPRFSHLGSTVIEQPAAESRIVKVRPGRVTHVAFGGRGKRMTIRFVPSPGPRWTLSLRNGYHVEKFNPQGDGLFLVEVKDRTSHPDIYLHFYDAASDAEWEIWQGRIQESGSSLTLALPNTLVKARLSSAGRPIAHQTVNIHLFDNRLPVGRVRTDNQGNLRIPHLPPGTYTLALGDRPLSFISVQAGRRVDLGRFDLLPGSF